MRARPADVAAAVLTAGALTLGGPARADPPPAAAVEIGDLDLDGLLQPRVAAVSLHEQAASAAPASVFVLTRDDLQAHGFKTLAEALRSVPGLFTYSDGYYQYVGFRGVGLLADYTLRILVLVDGHPLDNTLGLAENSLGLDLLVPLSMVERVEVVKGPVGSVYGPAAFLGVVNVVTRAADREVDLALGARASQRRVVQGDASAATFQRLGDLTLSVGAEAVTGPGYTWTFPELAAASDRPAPPGGRVAGMDHGDAAKGYLRAAWRGVTVQGGCGHWYRRLPAAPYSSIVGDRNDHEETLDCFGQVGVERDVTEHLSIAGRVSYDWFEYRDLFEYAPPPVDTGSFGDMGRDRWTSVNLQATWRPVPSVLATAGATGEYHSTVQDSHADLIPTRDVDPVNGVGMPPIHKEYATVNAYLLTEWRLTSWLAVHGGVTAFHHEIFGSRITPRGAAIWHPSRRDTVKAIYTEGFRAPSASEAFFYDGTDFVANLALKPETARQGELVYERRFGTALSLFVSAFSADYRSLIRYETIPAPGLGRPPDPATPEDWRQQARNGGHFGMRGAELGGRLRVVRWIDAYGGVTVQRPVGDAPPNTAGVTANLAVATRAPWEPLSLAVRGFYVGERDKDRAALLPGQRATVPAQVRLDATAVLDVPAVRGLSVEVSVLNLLDRRVLHPVPNDFAPITEMAEPPLTGQATLRYRR
jgi:iron complex outermembrane receptor protein